MHIEIKGYLLQIYIKKKIKKIISIKIELSIEIYSYNG